MLIFLVIVLILLLIKPGVVSIAVIDSAKLWFFSLVPVLYPSLIIIELITKESILKMVSLYSFPVTKKIFHINYPDSLLVIIIAILCGAPASTKAIESLKENGAISKEEGNALTYAFSSLSIFYLISIFSKINLSFGIYIFFSILSSIIILWILNKRQEVSFFSEEEKKPFLQNMFQAIDKSTKIMINIISILMFFKIIISLFSLQNSLIYPFLEILGGLNLLTKKEIPSLLLAFLFISSVTFLGISIHLQILFINPKLNYGKFLLIKLFQTLFVSLFFLIIYIIPSMS